jgi:hypothetical protein
LAELLESNASPKPKLGRRKVPNLVQDFDARVAPPAHDVRISDHLYARKEDGILLGDWREFFRPSKDSPLRDVAHMSFFYGISGGVLSRLFHLRDLAYVTRS